MEYHKTKDILYVKKLLGHKRIESTMLYTQLIDFSEHEYNCKVAENVEEAKKLVEAGFEFVTDFDAYKLFRKRK
ncbi:MAG: hypothetical protein NWE91_07845 [Candidatus Bathyarchaeota archaeon]|nr:hypothetical protein [Candidatus Bathyarchaeota archaeon]